ncbi:MAG TPA: hypothetical protein VIK45_00385 [Candidatus Dormibacteraeota bacterium]
MAAVVCIEGRANRAFALGLASLLVGVLGPFALVSGWRSVRAIATSGGTLSGEGRAVFGLVAGFLSTLFLLLGSVHFLLAGLL